MGESSEAGSARRWGAILLGVGLAGLIFWWASPEEGEPPSAPAGADSAPVPVEEPRLAVASEEAFGLELSRNENPILRADSLVAGKPLRVRITLPSNALGIGIKSIWVYGEGQTAAPIEGERATPATVSLAIPAELLTPGRHFVELRTDEITHIPLRRFPFEIR